METVKNITAILSLVISLTTVFTVSVPGIRRKLGEALLKGDVAKEEMRCIRKMLETHVAEDQKRKEEMELQREVDLCVLRDLITGIYYRYAKKKAIPIYALENANALFELYRKRGGNSYVKTLVGQMTEEWEVLQ